MATLYEDLIAAGLPVESASLEHGVRLLPGSNMTLPQWNKLGEIVLSHQSPAAYTDLLQFRADRDQLKNEYQSTVNTLLDIENRANPTNAQVITAIRFLAKTVRIMLKLFVRIYKESL